MIVEAVRVLPRNLSGIRGPRRDLDGYDTALAGLLFRLLSALSDEAFFARQRDVHQARELMRDGPISSSLVDVRVPAAVERSEHRIAPR